MTDPNPTQPELPATPESAPFPPASTPPPAEPPPVPPSSWREPSWGRPPAHRNHYGSLVFGVILVVIGLWFFADRTLGLSLPRLSWGQLWPIILIGIGAWLLLRSVARRR